MHHHHHHHTVKSERRLWVSVILNLAITAAEVIGGVLSGSLALLADALHNLNDTASLVISLIAHRIARQQPDERRTFGYRRAEVIGALINLVTLVLIALYLIKEAVERYLHPQPIDGELMMGVALVGLLANVGTALLLYRDAQHSLNIRSAFVHIVADAVSSVGVILGGIFILLYQVYWLDTLLSLLISGYILAMSYRMIKKVVNILMEGVPPGIDVKQVIRTLEALPGITDVHHVHIWQLDEQHIALEAHVVPTDCSLEAIERVKQQVKEVLREQFGISHSTLEVELSACMKMPVRCFEKQEESYG